MFTYVSGKWVGENSSITKYTLSKYSWVLVADERIALHFRTEKLISYIRAGFAFHASLCSSRQD